MVKGPKGQFLLVPEAEMNKKHVKAEVVRFNSLGQEVGRKVRGTLYLCHLVCICFVSWYLVC